MSKHAVSECSANENEIFWQIGENYFVQTVTMYFTGKLKTLSKEELVFENPAWIADTGRFHDALKNSEFSEIEPYVNDILVNRTAIICTTQWNGTLPNKQK